jgi:hypothetical protein
MEVGDSLARAAWLSGGRQLQLVIGLRCSKDRWYLVISRRLKMLGGALAEISRSAYLKHGWRFTITMARVNLG